MQEDFFFSSSDWWCLTLAVWLGRDQFLYSKAPLFPPPPPSTSSSSSLLLLLLLLFLLLLLLLPRLRRVRACVRVLVVVVVFVVTVSPSWGRQTRTASTGQTTSHTLHNSSLMHLLTPDGAWRKDLLLVLTTTVWILLSYFFFRCVCLKSHQEQLCE